MAMRFRAQDFPSDQSVRLFASGGPVLLEVFVRDPRNKDPRTAFDGQTGEHGYWEAVPVVR